MLCISRLSTATSQAILRYFVIYLQALNSNPKIEVVNDNGQVLYKFKGKFNIKDRKGLIKLLDKNDQRGMGGTLLEDIEESLPNCAKQLKVRYY